MRHVYLTLCLSSRGIPASVLYIDVSLLVRGREARKKKRERRGVLTDHVRTERDTGVRGRQHRIELHRRGMLEIPGDAQGEVVAHAQREDEERDRQETDLAEVEGHDPAPGVPHEIGAVHVTGAEAQAVFLDLGPEADTIVPACVPKNLCRES